MSDRTGIVRKLAERCHITIKDANVFYDVMQEALMEHLLENKQLNVFNIIEINLEPDGLNKVKLTSSFTRSTLTKIRSLVKHG